RRAREPPAVFDAQIGNCLTATDTAGGLRPPEPSPTPRNRAGLPQSLNALAQRDRLRNDAGNGLAMIGDHDGPAGPDFANAFAQRRLEFPDSDSLLSCTH